MLRCGCWRAGLLWWSLISASSCEPSAGTWWGSAAIALLQPLSWGSMTVLEEVLLQYLVLAQRCAGQKATDLWVSQVLLWCFFVVCFFALGVDLPQGYCWALWGGQAGFVAESFPKVSIGSGCSVPWDSGFCLGKLLSVAVGRFQTCMTTT